MRWVLRILVFGKYNICRLVWCTNMVCRLVAGVLMQKPGVFRQHLPSGKSEMGYMLCILTAKTAWFLQQLKQPVAKLPALLFDPPTKAKYWRSLSSTSQTTAIFRFLNSVICIQGKRLSYKFSALNFFLNHRTFNRLVY